MYEKFNIGSAYFEVDSEKPKVFEEIFADFIYSGEVSEKFVPQWTMISFSFPVNEGLWATLWLHSSVPTTQNPTPLFKQFLDVVTEHENKRLSDIVDVFKHASHLDKFMQFRDRIEKTGTFLQEW